MFGVEALKDSREFSEARFGDAKIVQGASVGKLCSWLLSHIQKLQKIYSE
ncbi:Uncharacterized protein BM_BM17114 [Brugia malayi]|uniref:Uncharacterized protein n=1 Tax=Brugia malayi TaxID=6279 RepID=A0A4E9FTA7_BRUMA|nr:Uncharacterized protein BM_BM17114 [Brugia malayi]VIO99921.1 Uncharacterized protein BM_BM17114 [Brugia malayi]